MAQVQIPVFLGLLSITINVARLVDDMHVKNVDSEKLESVDGTHLVLPSGNSVL